MKDLLYTGSGTLMDATTRNLRLRVNGNTPKPSSIGNKIGRVSYYRSFTYRQHRLQTTFAGQWDTPKPFGIHEQQMEVIL